MSRVCQRDVQQLCGQVLSRKTRGRVWTHLGGTALSQFVPLGAHMLTWGTHAWGQGACLRTSSRSKDLFNARRCLRSDLPAETEIPRGLGGGGACTQCYAARHPSVSALR